MRIVVQRVTESSVSVDGKVVGAVGKGYMILVGVEDADTPEDADWLARKVAALRVFDDEAGVMNLDIRQVGGRSAGHIAIYALCQLQEEQPPIMVSCRQAARRRAALPPLLRPTGGAFGRRQGGTGYIWGRYEGGIGQRWACDHTHGLEEQGVSCPPYSPYKRGA